MITEARPSEESVAVQIHAVAQAAYALEAEQIGCTDFPPLHESLDQLRCSSDRFLVFQRSDRIIAALSFHNGVEPVPITRLVVSPVHLRQGIATALLADLERRLPPATRLTVSTARANAPAVALYRQLGYTATGATTSAEGIPLLHLTKTNDRNA